MSTRIFVEFSSNLARLNMSQPIDPIKILVSACLLGQRVRYDGGHSKNDAHWLARWRAQGRIVAFCPEVAGGLSTPRPPAQIVDADGEAVLDGTARILTRDGEDVTEAFITGARATLKVAQDAAIRIAILKSKSPSCGSQRIYNTQLQPDGSSQSALVAGAGVTTALLRRHQIAVFNEHQLELAQQHLDALVGAL